MLQLCCVYVVILISHTKILQKLFFVYNCLRRRNVERWTKSVTGAHIIIPIMYLCFGIFGALNFESMTDDDRSQIEYNYYAQFTSVRGSKIVYDISRYLFNSVMH